MQQEAGGILETTFFRNFSKSEKVLSGHDCVKALDEETIEKLGKLNDKIVETEANLCDKFEKCTDMFKESSSYTRKSKKKRSEKQNRRICQ